MHWFSFSSNVGILIDCHGDEGAESEGEALDFYGHKLIILGSDLKTKLLQGVCWGHGEGNLEGIF